MRSRFWIVRLILTAVALGLPTLGHAQTETVEYYGLDALGSVRIVFSSSGTILGRMDYGPFGEELFASSGIPKDRFAGLLRDGEAGLDYAKARAYQVRTGRFSAPDPIRLTGMPADSWLAQTFFGNDFASAVDLVRDFNIPDAVSTVISNPFPANATAWTVDWVLRQRVGPRDVAVLRETSSGHIEVDKWTRRWQIGKTAAGKAVGGLARVASTGKLWYDGLTFAGAAVYCIAR